MSKQLHQVVTQIMGMGYYVNEAARSGGQKAGHEEAVAQKFKDAGFAEYKANQFPALSKAMIYRFLESQDPGELDQALATMTPGSYILQPAGSQNFPDLLVKDHGGRYLIFECKSSKTANCPMWNDNVPKQNAVYIFSSGKAKETTVFLGRDVIVRAQYAIFAEQEAAHAKVDREFALRLKQADVHGRGFTQRSRRQHFQVGGKAYSNYFTHKDRKKCEQAVLTLARQ